MTVDSLAQRVSSARLEVAMVAGQSTVLSAYASSPLKLLTPRPRAESVWAYTSSFGGGLLAGDQTLLEVRIGSGARCFLSTQANTKVYRNPASLPCAHATRAVLEQDALLVFAPDRVQPFAGSIYSQTQEFHLGEGAGLVLLDWFCSGRMARQERWHFARFRSRNDVFVGGHRVFVDSILLEGSPDPRPWRVGHYDCFAMLLVLGPPLRGRAENLLHELNARPVVPNPPLLCTASPLADGVLVRLAGTDPEDVGREIEKQLQPLSALLGDNPWIRKW